MQGRGAIYCLFTRGNLGTFVLEGWKCVFSFKKTKKIAWNYFFFELFWYANIKNNFFKNKKNIIFIHSTKNTLKNNRYHTSKHYLILMQFIVMKDTMGSKYKPFNEQTSTTPPAKFTSDYTCLLTLHQTWKMKKMWFSHCSLAPARKQRRKKEILWISSHIWL